MILRTVSPCMDDKTVAVSRLLIVLVEKGAQRGEAVEPLVPAPWPAALEHDDGARGVRAQVMQEFGAQRAHDRRRRVVKEVEVVQEARGLPNAEAEQRV